MKNEPAFPSKGILVHDGLTKLELCAFMAMQGIVASNTWDDCDEVAKISYNLAEAMLKESEKRGK